MGGGGGKTQTPTSGKGFEYAKCNLQRGTILPTCYLRHRFDSCVICGELIDMTNAHRLTGPPVTNDLSLALTRWLFN